MKINLGNLANMTEEERQLDRIQFGFELRNGKKPSRPRDPEKQKILDELKKKRGGFKVGYRG